MRRKYELKKVDEKVWENTPKKIQDMRRRFSFLRDEVTKSSKKIEKYQGWIKREKTKKKELETVLKEHYQKLVTFQIDNFNIPTVSPTYQKGDNNQWSINLTIGDIKRKKYLGSNKKVRERLDYLKDVDYYTINMYKTGDNDEDWTERCRVEIKKIIHRNLVKEMDNDVLSVFKRWKKNELKMWDYFHNKEAIK